MCGIFGYVGKNKNASKVLLHGLEKLEYRGYDSAGIVVSSENSEFKLIKSVGKVSFLSEKIQKELNHDLKYSIGIAHTRWATHGGVTESNCHPHTDSRNRIFLVHNGIVENYKELKSELMKKGYEFYSDTDSEVVAKLGEEYWQGNLLDTVELILPMLKGAYALLFISTENPEEMIGVKYGSPLVFAFDSESKESYFSSDTQAISSYADNIIFLDDGELVYVNNGDYTIKSEGKLINKAHEKIDVNSLISEKGDFEHFMLKEIHEQPKVLEEVFRGRINFEENTLNAAAFQELAKHDFKKAIFIACGTSYHAGWLGTYWFEDIAGIDARHEIASEFEYKNVKIDKDTLYIFISQSGETADSIEPLKYIKSRGGHTFGIVNVVGSTISRLTDFGMFTRAGTEVGVASTKAFIGQIATILILALYFGEKNNFQRTKHKEIIENLQKLPKALESIINDSYKIKEVASKISSYNQFFFLGRHYELPIAYESSLKFKEITYLNSQALPTGELKHGSLALIDSDFPSVVFIPRNFLFQKNLSSIEEIKARKGKVLSISDSPIGISDWDICVPQVNEYLTPFTMIVAGQILSYYTANNLGKEIDKPRNLAKSVTVK